MVASSGGGKVFEIDHKEFPQGVRLDSMHCSVDMQFIIGLHIHGWCLGWSMDVAGLGLTLYIIHSRQENDASFIPRDI